jgi:hypothetical protein
VGADSLTRTRKVRGGAGIVKALQVPSSDPSRCRIRAALQLKRVGFALGTAA